MTHNHSVSQADIDLSQKTNEEQRKKDIENLKSQYEQKLVEILKLNKGSISEKEKKWTEEKHHLQK